MIFKKIHFILFLCLCLMIQIGCTNQTNNNQNTYANQEAKEDELLYGKYPEPILKVISDNIDANKDYKKLTVTDLKNIKGISFGKAREYDFEDNTEYDFSIFLEMTNLKFLSINFGDMNIRLKDYSILNKMNSLEKLFIGNIYDSDIESINRIASLKQLFISNSNISKLSFLENFSDLEFFSLSDQYTLEDYSDLKYLKKLKFLNLFNLGLSENQLSTIPNIDTLNSLSLVGNNIKDMASFPQMVNLESLALENNPIEKINIPANTLPRIRYLNIVNTSISDVNNIQGMDTIEEIIIKNTKITKVDPFKRYKNLKFINANLNNIIDTKSLDGTKIIIGEE